MSYDIQAEKTSLVSQGTSSRPQLSFQTSGGPAHPSQLPHICHASLGHGPSSPSPPLILPGLSDVGKKVFQFYLAGEAKAHVSDIHAKPYCISGQFGVHTQISRF